MTLVKPARMAAMTLAKLAPWSRWMTTGTVEAWARLTMAATASEPMCFSSLGWISMMTGASLRSEMSMIPLNMA